MPSNQITQPMMEWYRMVSSGRVERDIVPFRRLTNIETMQQEELSRYFVAQEVETAQRLVQRPIVGDPGHSHGVETLPAGRSVRTMGDDGVSWISVPPARLSPDVWSRSSAEQAAAERSVEAAMEQGVRLRDQLSGLANEITGVAGGSGGFILPPRTEPQFIWEDESIRQTARARHRDSTPLLRAWYEHRNRITSSGRRDRASAVIHTQLAKNRGPCGSRWSWMNSDVLVSDYVRTETMMAVQKKFNAGHYLGALICDKNWEGMTAAMHADIMGVGTWVSKNRVRDSLMSKGLHVWECGCCQALGVNDVSRVDSLIPGQSFCQFCVNIGNAVVSTIMGGGYIARVAAMTYCPRPNCNVSECDWVLPSWAMEYGLVCVNDVYYPADDYPRPALPQQTGLYDYHCGPNLGHIPSRYDERKPRVLLGMELEVEGQFDGHSDEDGEWCDGEDRNETACYIVNGVNAEVPGYMKAEHDGSLDSGFEMITGYTGLDVHEKAVKLMCQHIASSGGDLRSHDTTTCGLHVHVDRKGMTPLHCAKLQQFINARENYRLLMTVGRRYQEDSGYAVFTDDAWMRRIGRAVAERTTYLRNTGYSVKDHLNFGQLMEDLAGSRYKALNWNNRHTVEFRMFRGTVRFESIMACLEFAFASWHFTREAPINQLDVEHFMSWICKASNRKDTRYLRAYLRAKRFKEFFVEEVKARPKDKKLAAQGVEREVDLSRDVHCTIQYQNVA